MAQNDFMKLLSKVLNFTNSDVDTVWIWEDKSPPPRYTKSLNLNKIVKYYCVKISSKWFARLLRILVLKIARSP